VTYRTTEGIFSIHIFLEAYDLAMMTVSFFFINFFSKQIVFQKNGQSLALPVLRYVQARGRTCFPWSPLEAALSISKFCFLFTRFF